VAYAPHRDPSQALDQPEPASVLPRADQCRALRRCRHAVSLTLILAATTGAGVWLLLPAGKYTASVALYLECEQSS
jgi:hypothetical protein